MARGNTKVTHSGWLEAARDVLIEDGISGLKADRLAKRLGVTRGGFYYHFKSLQAMLDALVEKWWLENRFHTIIADTSSRESAFEALREVCLALIHEKQFDPMFDLAVREWSRVDDKVLKVVKASDEYRMMRLKELFGALDQDEKTAGFHAKLFYYQQLGYYVLGVKEATETREANLDMWLKLLAGPIAD
jgi:AcrR family transcriptional regulator